MSTELMEQVKEVLGTQEHLFNKLHKTGRNYESIDFDESGLYDDEEERAFRHWKTLTTKLAEALRSGLDAQKVSVKKCKNPSDYSAIFTITSQDEEPIITSFEVSYANEGEIAIVQA